MGTREFWLVMLALFLLFAVGSYMYDQRRDLGQENVIPIA